MNTFEYSADRQDERVEPEARPLAEKTSPAPAPPRGDDSLPVLPRPANQRAEDFLPEWLRRLSRA